MGRIIDIIKSGKILISDGAWGTILQSKGLKVGECPELWNITHPEDVYDIAKSYIDAGADMIETNSFGANRFKLEHYALSPQMFEINKLAAEISRKAAGADHFVLGSIGSTGKLLMMEEVSPVELYEAFREQAIALETGGVDAILIETMTDLDEALLAVNAAKENTRCEIFCTMSFEKISDTEYRTIMGISPVEMVNKLVEAGVDVVGANCGNGAAEMVGIIKEIRNTNKTVPVLIQSNAGMPVYKEGKIIYQESPEAMAAISEMMIAAGANIIGGCCGTTPEHIRQIAAVINIVNKKVTG